MLITSLSIVLGISLIMNIFLIWYAFNSIKQIHYDQVQINGLITELEELQDMIGVYVGHLHSVGELEMFYGDETLRELMRHGQTVVDAFRDYQNSYSSLLEQKEDTGDDETEDNQTTQNID
jgi:hypothetical protein